MKFTQYVLYMTRFHQRFLATSNFAIFKMAAKKQSYFRISNTNASLEKLVHIGSCCKLNQQATAKRWRITITNYCSEISKREKQRFDHFSLRSSQSTQVAENMTVRHRSCQFLPLELYYNTKLGAVIAVFLQDQNYWGSLMTLCSS